MKKLLALILALGVLLALGAPALAAEEDVVMLSAQKLKVDGTEYTCEKYNINGNNFFKLRDLAALLNGTGSQFDVEWDAGAGLVSITSQHAYAWEHRDGHELEQRGDFSGEAVRSAQTIEIDGAERSDLTVWNIGGSNFFMLRELGRAIGFVVDYEPASNTAIVESLPVLPHTLLVAVGETAFADLDGDGTENAVRFWLAPNEYGWYDAHLSIDGADCTEAMYAARGGNHFDCPDEYWWAVTDLDTADGLLEIAVQDWGPSDDLSTSFFRFDGKALTYLGAPEGFLYFQNGAATMTVGGDGTLRSQWRLSVVQTWWTMVTYALGGDGRIAVVPQDFYTSTFENQQTELLAPLYGYDAPNGTKRILPAGTKAQIVGTDNVEWVKLLLSDGGAVWLHLLGEGEYKYQFECPDGPVYTWEALSDLCMAD